MDIRIAGELYDSLANGPDMRYVLFTQGCSMKCPGCQNMHTWDKEAGDIISIDEVMEHIKKSPFIKGVTLSGGDPIDQPEAIYELCKRIKTELPDLNIMMYTGRTIEALRSSKLSSIQNILDLIDYIVDGRFEQDNTDNARLYTGSANQRIFNLKTGEEKWF